MLALQNATKNITQKIGMSLSAICFVVIIITVPAFCINNAKASNITVIDTIELACDINVNQDSGISIYKLTVAGIRTGGAYAGEVPPVIFRSFDLITDGSIESIESIALSVYINGELETVKYDFAYAVLKEVDIDGNVK